MAGHSKWANTKHRKAAQDAKRGKIFTKIIRELSATVPIVVQSAYAYPQDQKAAKEAGCSDFISKPIVQSELKKMLNKWLSPELNNKIQE